MLFAYSTDDRSLIAFRSESDAIAHAEGIDVEDGVWRFYAEDGSPLEPVFTKPNQRGRISVVSGQYVLRPSQQPDHLKDILKDVATFEGELQSRAAVEHVLTRRSTSG